MLYAIILRDTLCQGNLLIKVKWARLGLRTIQAHQLICLPYILYLLVHLANTCRFSQAGMSTDLPNWAYALLIFSNFTP